MEYLNDVRVGIERNEQGRIVLAITSRDLPEQIKTSPKIGTEADVALHALLLPKQLSSLVSRRHTQGAVTVTVSSVARGEHEKEWLISTLVTDSSGEYEVTFIVDALENLYETPGVIGALINNCPYDSFETAIAILRRQASETRDFYFMQLPHLQLDQLRSWSAATMAGLTYRLGEVTEGDGSIYFAEIVVFPAEVGARFSRESAQLTAKDFAAYAVGRFTVEFDLLIDQLTAKNFVGVSYDQIKPYLEYLIKADPLEGFDIAVEGGNLSSSIIDDLTIGWIPLGTQSSFRVDFGEVLDGVRAELRIEVVSAGSADKEMTVHVSIETSTIDVMQALDDRKLTREVAEELKQHSAHLADFEVRLPTSWKVEEVESRMLNHGDRVELNDIVEHVNRIDFIVVKDEIVTRIWLAGDRIVVRGTEEKVERILF